MSVIEVIVPIAALIVVSAACAITRKGFSVGIFMAAISVGISILVWSTMLPFYALTFAAIMIVLILFKDGTPSRSESVE